MCFSTPEAPKPGAQPAPAAAAGADSLILGPTSNTEEDLRQQGLLGRLALRVGRGRAGTPGSPGGGTTVGPVGPGTGGSSGGGSPGSTPTGGSGGVGSGGVNLGSSRSGVSRL